MNARSAKMRLDEGAPTLRRLGDSPFAECRSNVSRPQRLFGKKSLERYEPRVDPWQPTGDVAAYVALTTAQAAARQSVAEATWLP